MDDDITRYLNDHLAESSGALLLIQELADTHDAPEARVFFIQLKKKVEAERALLEDLLERIGQNPSELLKASGRIAARIGSIKWKWEQIKPDKLGLFETLEILAHGVQGKRLLWITLREIGGWFHEWNGIDFVKWELRAIQQRDDIEYWRLQAAREILTDSERRADGNPEVAASANRPISVAQ